MKDLKHNFSFQLLSAVAGLLFPLITFPYVSTALGPAMVGKVNYVDFLANLVISLTCLGIPLYGIRQIARNRNDPDKRNSLLAALLKWHLVLAMAGCIFFAVFLHLHPRYSQEPLLSGLGIIYVLSNVLAADWYLQGMEAFRFLAMRNLVLRAAGLVALFILVRGPEHYWIYYAIIAITQLATVLINWAYIRPGLGSRRPVMNENITFSVLFYFFIASTFISIYDFTDTVMLGWLTGDAEVGYYTTAMKLIRLALSLLVVLNTILFPRFSWFQAEEKQEEADRLLRRSLHFIFTLAIPVMVLFYLLAPELIRVFAGERFAPAVAVIRWLSPLPLLITLSNLFLMVYLAKFSKARWIWGMVIVAMFIDLLLNYLLIPGWREQGAAIASLCTEAFIMLVFFIALRIKMEWKVFFISLAISACFLPLVMLLRRLDLSAIQTLLFTGTAAGIYYGLTQWFLGNETLRSIRDYLWRR